AEAPTAAGDSAGDAVEPQPVEHAIPAVRAVSDDGPGEPVPCRHAAFRVTTLPHGLDSPYFVVSDGGVLGAALYAHAPPAGGDRQGPALLGQGRARPGVLPAVGAAGCVADVHVPRAALDPTLGAGD